MPDLPDGHLAQLHSLALPSAALVLDVRGIEKDDVIDRLQVEIADLANEMQAYEINHWRHLTAFLSLRQLTPLTDDEIAAEKKAQQQTQTPSSGIIDEQTGWNHTDFNDFQQSLRGITLEIDRVRRNRIVAYQDLPKSGKMGLTRRDPTVRVILVADANTPASLASAAIYAARIKEVFHKRERRDQLPLVHTTVMCLDNQTEAEAADKLAANLSWQGGWEHIDSLFINEQYNEEGARLTGPTQTYLAELILYVLLLVPPLDLSNDTLMSGQDLDTHPTTGQVYSKAHTLPPATFSVGLATIEHSARWGHRWLNYSLAVSMMQMLLDRSGESPHERRLIQNTMTNWLDSWRTQITTAIPDKVPGDISGLRALSTAERAAKEPEELFPDRSVGLRTPELSIRTLQKHQDNLLALYLPTPVDGTEASQTLTLPAAVNSIPLIEQRLREWEERDPALKKGMPLVNAQSEAQNILGKHLFSSKGAVPRAREQLRELSLAISEFQGKHNDQKIDLEESRKQLGETGSQLLKEFQKQGQHFPFIAAFLGWKRALGVLAILMLMLLVWIAVLLGFGVTANALLSNHANTPLLSLLLGLFEFDSFPAAVFWPIFLLADIVVVFLLGRELLRHNADAFRVEINFLLVSLIFFGCTVAFDFLLNSLLTNGYGGPGVVTWFTWIGTVVIIAWVVIVVTELIYFYLWQRAILRQREQIVTQLNGMHLQNIANVKTYIADSIALELLVRTGLTDGEGGTGEYYQRMVQLSRQLNEILNEARKQQELAAGRLGSSMSQITPIVSAPRMGNGEWLRLRTREEFLDIPALTDGYKRWQAFLEKDGEQIKHFTELLLRIMGQEVPAQIEQQFRERTPLNNYYEQHQARLFLEVLVSIILRFVLAPNSIGSLSAIAERYDTLKNGYMRELPVIGVLIQALNQQVSQVAITPILTPNDGSMPPITQEDRRQLALEAFSMWGQVLWDHQDERLDACLSRRGVLAKMMADPEYEPMALMRQIVIRLQLFANSVRVGQQIDAYMLLAPSDQSRQLRHSLNIDNTGMKTLEFPDNERLVLFFIKRYVAPSSQTQQALGPGKAASMIRLGPANAVVSEPADITTPPAGASGSSLSIETP